MHVIEFRNLPLGAVKGTNDTGDRKTLRYANIGEQFTFQPYNSKAEFPTVPLTHCMPLRSKNVHGMQRCLLKGLLGV